MKRFLISLTLLLFMSPVIAGAQSESLVIIAGYERLYFSTQPITVNDHTLVPIRQAAEKLGISVQWNGNTEEVTLSKGEKKLTMKIGEKNVLLGEKISFMPVEAMLINKTAMAPLRFVFEFFGKEVSYEDYGLSGLYVWITDFKLLSDEELLPDDRYYRKDNYYVLKEGEKTSRGIGKGDSLSSVEFLYGEPAKTEQDDRSIYYFGKYDVNTSARSLVFILDKSMSKVEEIRIY